MYDLLGSDKISLNSFRFPYFKVCLHNSNLRQQQKENLFTRPPKEHSTIIIIKLDFVVSKNVILLHFRISSKCKICRGSFNDHSCQV